ncbi:MAG: histone deacetylase [Chloroflexota bacterium]|nr:histone deacetylase [Chloroflexota bacterium]
MSVFLLTDAAMDRHTTPGHPERPGRRAAVADGVRDAAGDDLTEPVVEPIDRVSLEAIHDPAYLALVEEAETRGGGWLDADTYIAEGSFQAARLAAGATLQAAIAAAVGDTELAFAVVRPPGHHASRSGGSGFCLLNNLAIAVAGLRARGLAERIAVVDWDVHHGDGTQAIFDADASLCYASTHQSPLYPGSGERAQSGTGGGRGTKHNRPLPPNSGDRAFTDAWRELVPIIEAFGPDSILVSAGYDAHVDDPLANLEVTEEGFETIAELIGGLSGRLGHPGVALTLEGGYDLDALRASGAATVRGILAGRAAAGGRL